MEINDCCIQTVATGLMDQQCRKVYASVTYRCGCPVVLGHFTFDNYGNIIPMSKSTPFSIAEDKSVTSSTNYERLFCTDLDTGEVVEIACRVITKFDSEGNIMTGYPQQVYLESDKVTAHTPPANPVYSMEKQCVALGTENVTVTTATASTLTIPTNAKSAKIYVDAGADDAAVRFTIDGTTPSNNNGIQVNQGGTIDICKAADLAGFRILALDEDGNIDAAATAHLTVTYVNVESLA